MRHKPGGIHELKWILPCLALGLISAFLLPFEWFPKFTDRYSVFVAFMLLMIGFDATTSFLKMAGLMEFLDTLPLPQRLSPFHCKLLMAFCFVCTAVPIVFFIGNESFRWLATLLSLLLASVSIVIRVAARRTLSDCEGFQKDRDSVG